jgi:hypothetical protein
LDSQKSKNGELPEELFSMPESQNRNAWHSIATLSFISGLTIG